MSDKLAARIYIYDSICNAYSKLHDVEKDDFDKGLTMIFNNQYFAKNKKSNINHDSPIIFEIMDLSAVAINLSNLISGTEKFIKLVDISSQNEINTFYDDLIKGKKINGKVLLRFIRVLKSMAVISIMSEVGDEAQIKAKTDTVDLYFKIIQARHNFDLNKIPLEIKSEYIGKPTIILYNTIDSSSDFLNALKKLKLICKNQNQENFKSIFGDKEIMPIQRVVWIGSNYSLMVFLQSIIEFTTFKSLKNLYVTATRCFIKENGIPFEFKEISGARGDSNLKEQIETIVNKSFTNSKRIK